MGNYCLSKNFETQDIETTPGKNDRLKNIAHKLKSNSELLFTLIRVQSRFRGLIVRKKVKSVKVNGSNIENDPNNEFKRTYDEKITKQEVAELFNKYKSLPEGNSILIDYPVEFDNKAVYYGEWEKTTKQRHGRGIQIWNDGSKYEGYWKNDKANILGKLLHADGDIYEGQWVDDKAHGFGVYMHVDGAVYEGMWKEDKQDGYGKETWPDGACYEGEYKNGKKSGKGLFKWSDGSQYDGFFQDNHINGKGNYTWNDKRQFVGDWKNNKMDGEGVFIWPDQRKYNGQYKEDKKHGYGTFEWNDGRKYKGYWKNGKQHGEGEFYQPDQKIWKKGVWSDGRRVSWKNPEPS